MLAFARNPLVMSHSSHARLRSYAMRRPVAISICGVLLISSLLPRPLAGLVAQDNQRQVYVTVTDEKGTTVPGNSKTLKMPVQEKSKGLKRVESWRGAGWV